MNRIEEFCSYMHELGVDAFIVHNKDEYLNEYAKNLEELCGFTGTNGTLIILKDDKCHFFTDGRYITQARNQLDQSMFEIYTIGKMDPCKWVKENLSLNFTSGYYSQYFTIEDIRKYEGACRLLPCTAEKIDNYKKQKIVSHPIEYSGESSASKCMRIAQTIGAQALLLTDPDSVSWLLNIRNENAHYTPHVFCRAILYKDGNVDLFIHDKRSSTLEANFDDSVKMFDVKKLASALHELNSIVIDPSTTPMSIASFIDGKHVIEKKDPCVLSKAIKNQTEIIGAKSAHIKDGIAVTNFLYWLENHVNMGITELDAEEKLFEYRKKQSLFRQQSFPTISAFNENAAVIHYRASYNTNKVIKEDGLYLIDSGGQYLDGTTDVTRTVAIGIPTEEQVIHYTAVLKAHIALSSSIFPRGTTGGELDAVARTHLWKFGMDYAHGTGHGVGSYLSVHEGPQAISKGNQVKLIPGMILSNEPGHYILNKYGIRIENLMYVSERKDGFLKFKQLTCVPYNKRLINVQMLAQDEVEWINNYHGYVYKNLNGSIGNPNWLKQMCTIL